MKYYVSNNQRVFQVSKETKRQAENISASKRMSVLMNTLTIL